MTLTPPMPTWSSTVPHQSPGRKIDRPGEPAQPISPTPMAISSRSIVSLVNPTHPQPERINNYPMLRSTNPMVPLNPGHCLTSGRSDSRYSGVLPPAFLADTEQRLLEEDETVRPFQVIDLIGLYLFWWTVSRIETACPDR